MTALMGGVALSSTAVLADHHMKVDADGDGMVSKSEFMDKHEMKFDQMDANNDGMLSKEEMKEARGKMKDKMKDRREKMKEKRIEKMEEYPAD